MIDLLIRPEREPRSEDRVQRQGDRDKADGHVVPQRVREVEVGREDEDNVREGRGEATHRRRRTRRFRQLPTGGDQRVRTGDAVVQSYRHP